MAEFSEFCVVIANLTTYLCQEVGVISEEAKNLVEAEGDLEILKRWHKFAARVNSIDEFVNKARLN